MRNAENLKPREAIINAKNTISRVKEIFAKTDFKKAAESKNRSFKIRTTIKDIPVSGENSSKRITIGTAKNSENLLATYQTSDIVNENGAIEYTIEKRYALNKIKSKKEYTHIEVIDNDDGIQIVADNNSRVALIEEFSESEQKVMAADLGIKI
jgi:tRNA U34 2-thiouridine synthase MnmA/TrmU